MFFFFISSSLSETTKWRALRGEGGEGGVRIEKGKEEGGTRE